MSSVLASEEDATASGDVRRSADPALTALLLLPAVLAFALYLVSSGALQARNATLHFGADAHLYAPLANGIIYDRVTRFHPVTVALAIGWLAMLKPLASWISAQLILKGMFAAIGAFGCWAATASFSMFMARREAALWGMIYAASFGVWYFSSIEESKIVSATLAASYILVYLRLRKGWTVQKALLLTAVLFLACLNEIVAGFLIAIPVVDTIVRRGWDIKAGRWIAAHGLAGIAALLVLELVVNGWWVPRSHDAESASHVSMLFHYLARNNLSLAQLYGFLLNWICFNIAAPASEAQLWVPGHLQYGSYFPPAISQYLGSFVSAGAALAFVAIGAASWFRRDEPLAEGKAILLALACYSLLRGAFFFLFNPAEVMLFTASVTLPHLLMIALPFSASRFRAKGALLLATAALLLLSNGVFMFRG